MRAGLRRPGDWQMPFPTTVTVNRLQTFSAYDRLSTAPTVAQVYSVQRLCNHYAARLALLSWPDPRARAIVVWRRLPSTHASSRAPSLINLLSRSQLDEVGLTSRDIILINQIIGFISFQARAIAVFHAALGYPGADPRHAAARRCSGSAFDARGE